MLHFTSDHYKKPASTPVGQMNFKVELQVKQPVEETRNTDTDQENQSDRCLVARYRWQLFAAWYHYR